MMKTGLYGKNDLGSSSRGVRKAWRALLTGCALSGALLVMGCEKSAKELMLEADSAIQKGDLERAEQVLGEAMKKAPDNYQAQILQAQLFVQKKQYKEAEDKLVAVWEGQKLGEEKLTTEQKRIKQLMDEQYFPDLYREWAESMDRDANPQKFEEVVNKGLKYDVKNRRLNSMLVDFLQARGEQLVKDGKKAEAADAFARVGELYTTSKTRKEATARAEALREEVKAERIAQRFEQELKPALVKDERYDAQNKLVLFMVEGEIDRRGTPEEALAAAEPLIAAKIDEAARSLSEVPENIKLGAPTKTEFFKIVESDFKRGAYKVVASFPEDQLKAYARFALTRAEEEAAKKEDGDKVKKTEDGAAQPAGEEGSEGAPDAGTPEEGAKEPAATP